MAATMANCEAAAKRRGQRLRHRHNNLIKEEAAFGRPPTLSDVRSVGGGASAGCRRWRLGGSMGLQRYRGSSGSASVGRRRQFIIIGGAMVAPSNARAVGGGVGGSTLAELWWGHCRGGGR